MSRAIRYLFALLVCVPTTAAAQSVGTALSGPEATDGASAYYNPAAMGAGRGTLLELDAGLVALGVDYVPDSGVAPSSTSILGPLLTLGGFTDVLHRDWRLGFTLSVPKTSGGVWSRDDGAARITRYYLVAGTSFHISAVPAVSWSPNAWLTVGLGVNLMYARLEGDLDKDFGAQLNQTAGSTAIDSPFPYANPDLAARINIGGSGFGAGAIAGVLVRPIPELTFGASLHSPVPVASTGDLEVTYPERLRQVVADTLPTAVLPALNGSVEMDVDVPLVFLIGMSARPHKMLDLAASYRFDNTSVESNFYTRITESTSPSITDAIKPQAYTNLHRVSLRVAVLPMPALRIAVSGAFQNNNVPESTTAPNNLGFTRLELGLTAAWRILENLGLTLQYSHFVLFDNEVNESLHRPLTQPSLAAFNHPSPTGLYAANADSIRLGVTVYLGANAASEPAVEASGDDPPRSTTR